jgi:hypothetical protein
MQAIRSLSEALCAFAVDGKKGTAESAAIVAEARLRKSRRGCMKIEKVRNENQQ